MRTAIALTAIFAATAYAQDSSAAYTNPFTSYLSLTNSLGVVTGQPKPVTTQPTAILTQPAVITTEATVPAGAPTLVVTSVVPLAGLNSTLVPVKSGGAKGTGKGAGTGKNSTVSTGSPSSTGGSDSTGTATTGGSGSTGTSTGASGSSTTGAAIMVQPALGLGFAGAIVAAFL